MQTTFFTNGRPVTGRPPQSVVAVSGDLLRAELLDALIADENDYGPIFLEPMTGAYSRIKEEMPDLVIVYCEADDDVAACQLLSMLSMDADLSGVLVVTFMSGQPSWTSDSVTMRHRPFERSCAITCPN